MQTVDPGTGQAFARFAAGDGEDVDLAVAAARFALTGPWKSATPGQRGKVLAAIAQLIHANAERLAVVECLDSGKRLVEALGDVHGEANCFAYYAGACDKHEGRSIPLGPDQLVYTVNEPVGVTAHIIPWNYPFSTAARGIAPALAAGCTVVAKPAEQTPLTCLMLAELCLPAGLPAGVCNVVTGTGASAGALEPALMADGVPMNKVYEVLSAPGGIERAIKKIKEIKPNIAVWWSSGAQHASLMKDGEVDMITGWNGRFDVAAEGWRQGRLNLQPGLARLRLLRRAQGGAEQGAGNEVSERGQQTPVPGRVHEIHHLRTDQQEGL